MKKIVKCYIACCLMAVVFTSCGDLYETHEKYLKMAEETYIGFADSLQANGGFNRIELKWKLNADPKISTCLISWNGSEKPLEVVADRSKEYMSKIIELPEGKYIFTVIVKSDSGKESLSQTVSGEVYGATYQSRLPQRGINSITASLSGGITLEWAPEEGCIRTNLTYSTKDGGEKTISVGEDETITILPDAVPGTEFAISSVFKPENEALDEVVSLPKVLSFISYYSVSKADWDATYHQQYADVDRTGWTIEASTEELVGELPLSGPADRILDGDDASFWHSQWNGEGGNPPLPHVLTIDMLKTQNIMSIELARRKSNKDTKTVVFSISDNKEDWIELGGMDFPDAVDPNTMIIVLPEVVSGRYLRTTVTASNNSANASIAEMRFTSGKKE
ncbi:DUF4998 domain-containing protein [uncultured Bacteroides sp.]|uniref:DUF4998 domain-containing protein n=1 Tax=uncultured Bacteroides sp. TaxID=162156 RepID=UPI0025FC450D|nr:DUF4998 domain-containing protein [uncultured Bacteroides sp.]